MQQTFYIGLNVRVVDSQTMRSFCTRHWSLHNATLWLKIRWENMLSCGIVQHPKDFLRQCSTAEPGCVSYFHTNILSWVVLDSVACLTWRFLLSFSTGSPVFQLYSSSCSLDSCSINPQAEPKKYMRDFCSTELSSWTGRDLFECNQTKRLITFWDDLLPSIDVT